MTDTLKENVLDAVNGGWEWLQLAENNAPEELLAKVREEIAKVPDTRALAQLVEKLQPLLASKPAIIIKVEEMIAAKRTELIPPPRPNAE